ncbi:carbohydrate binding protein with CBM9 domain [Arcicella aurantiaca]|uniref:Carbohydrate binding protein with CBM9 domain n=1 Tax=Arcicella aurantiaca TaxID=591202 RepID=A0A316E481_9BACT|nr:carbohydrate binding family 9 domain-containing protein [Arcicella aurantiaca]PWK24458.1 carbohydrate binding protein with CBM9 domain [Arcicella aurantiaca]
MNKFYLLTFLLLTFKISAQDIFLPDSIKKNVEATRIDTHLKVDGKLDESVWNQAKMITDFVQVEPKQKEPANQKTVFKLLYNADYLYVGAIMYEPEGKKALRVPNLQRDFDYGGSDQIGITIDGFNDERNAMIFMANPYGSQRDLLSFDDQVFDTNWDGLWRVRTTRTDTAWIAEFAIPWQTLRYQPNKDLQTWSINFFRLRRMTNEQTVWSALPRAFSPSRMQYAGKLTNLQAPPPSTNIRVQPYFLVSDNRYNGSELYEKKDGSSVKVGGEIKWAVTPNTVMDLTYNTDFAQADADRQVNNLSRLSVFFPERRQFFLENASLFAAGISPIDDNFGGQQIIQPFFSRSIGLNSNGTPIPIDVGFRLVNRSLKSNSGFLYVRQREVDANLATNFFVGRYSKNIGKQNRIGLIGTWKNDALHNNATASADGFFRINESTNLNTMAMFSGGTVQNMGFAGHYQLLHKGINWIYWLSQNINTKDFNPEMGFVSRPDVVENSIGAYWLNRGKWLPKFVRSFEPGGYYNNYYAVTTGKLVEERLNFNPIWFGLQSGAGIGVFTDTYYQLLDYSDGSSPLSFFNVAIPQGKYNYTRYSGAWFSDRSKKVSYSLIAETGKYYNGDLTTISANIRIAPIPHIALDGRITNNSYSGLGLKSESGSTQLYTISGRFALNPRVQLIGFYQHNSINNFDVWNVRFSWEYRPLSFIYLVLNKRGYDDYRTYLSNDGLSRIKTNELSRQNEQQSIIKVSYLKQF